MATLCIRSTDCLAGRASFGAHRGVCLAPALAPRLPMQQQRQHESQTLATASPPHVAMNSRSARGRANGQHQRRRRSPPASGAGSPPHKRVMDNVVILRRGQVLMNMATASLTATASAAGPSVAQAVPQKAETALAGKDEDAGVAAAVRGGEREKVDDESVAAAKQSSAEAEKCEIAAAVDQHGAQEEAAETAVAANNVGTETEEEEPVVATNQSGAETTTEDDEPEAAAGQSGAQAETAEPVAAVDQRGLDTREKKAEYRGTDAMKTEPAPAAHQTLPPAKEEAEQAYSGASFAAVAPDPRALPIPVRLLKPRCKSARIRVLAPDNDRAPAPTTAAA